MTQELIISNNTDLLRVSAIDVMAIKADGNYSIIILSDGDEKLVAFQLGQMEVMINEQLGANASTFIRIGRGVIINQEYMFAINLPKQELIVRSSSGKKATLSSSKEALRELKKYFDQKKGVKND
jgi:DNA-binding LytR/AlgR family response regulator